MKNIAVASGGGAMGNSSVQVLAKQEQRFNKPLCQYYNLVGGASVGAILMGILATGELTMAKLVEIFPEMTKKVFKKRSFLPIPPLYDKKNFKDIWNSILPENFKLGDVQTNLVIMCVEACSKTNLIIRSWEEDYKNYKLSDLLIWSFSAPLYFGQTNVPDLNKVMFDGGTGSANFPIDFVKTETEKFGWYNQEKLIFDLYGCCYTDNPESYSKVSKQGFIRQLQDFFMSKEGGLARFQTRNDQVGKMLSIANKNTNIGIRYWDTLIPKKLDGMDKLQYIPYYIDIGKKMAEKPLYEINC